MDTIIRTTKWIVLGSTLGIFFLSSCDEEIGTPPDPVTSDEFVDLRPQQTVVKSQGSRNTCITFAAVAGLEAAYKRLGYGDLDLSEEFMNHMGKTFWLHGNWDDILAKGEDGSETQVGAFGGGGGAGYINDMIERGAYEFLWNQKCRIDPLIILRPTTRRWLMTIGPQMYTKSNV